MDSTRHQPGTVGNDPKSLKRYFKSKLSSSKISMINYQCMLLFKEQSSFVAFGVIF
jgi:hypothetical protein